MRSIPATVRIGISPGTIGTVMPAARARADEVEVDAVVEEQLGDDEVEAGVDLGLEVRDVPVEVAALDVPLGVAGAAQAERACRSACG